MRSEREAGSNPLHRDAAPSYHHYLATTERDGYTRPCAEPARDGLDLVGQPVLRLGEGVRRHMVGRRQPADPARQVEQVGRISHGMGGPEMKNAPAVIRGAYLLATVKLSHGSSDGSIRTRADVSRETFLMLIINT